MDYVSSATLSIITLGCILGGILIGILLRRILPDHLNSDAKDVVRLGTGLIGTIAALVLGLLIASAKNTYDTQNIEVRQITANLILLDIVLAEYGDETLMIRQLMRRGVLNLIDRLWHSPSSGAEVPFEASREGEAVYSKLQELSPANDAQRSLQARAIQVATDVAQTRLLLFAQRNDGVPIPFLVVLVFWLTIIFASFSLFAQPSPIVLGALIVFAVSATGAIYLILELSQPFAGLLRISSDPLMSALTPLGR